MICCCRFNHVGWEIDLYGRWGKSIMRDTRTKPPTFNGSKLANLEREREYVKIDNIDKKF